MFNKKTRNQQTHARTPWSFFKGVFEYVLVCAFLYFLLLLDQTVYKGQKSPNPLTRLDFIQYSVRTRDTKTEICCNVIKKEVE